MVTRKRAPAARVGPLQLPALPRVERFELVTHALGIKPVMLRVAPRRTVLVGRNGAGKSAFVDGIELHSSFAHTGRTADENSSSQFRCDFIYHDDVYGYEVVRTKLSPPRKETERSWRFSERCWRMTPSEGTMWAVDDNGSVSFEKPTSQAIKLTPGTGLLSSGVVPPESIAHLTAILRQLFLHVHRVQASVPMSSKHRAISFALRNTSEGVWQSQERSRVNEATLVLLNWSEKWPEAFKAFQQVGQRLKLWSEVRKSVVAFPHPTLKTDEIGLIDIDGRNIGLQSDGTLKIIEILRYLLSPQERFLIIEEPETALHPGLVQRLMGELESYSMTHQLVLSTHSPLVVNHVSADNLRLVTRTGWQTCIHELTAKQALRIGEYLCDGDLGEFVFGGGLEDD